MSDNGYNREWLESRLDLFDSEKSGLSLDLHNKKHRSGLLSYVLCGASALAVVFAALLAFAPNGIVRGLYGAGLNVDVVLTILGVLAVACCASAALFSCGTVRMAALAACALTFVFGVTALLTMQQRLRPIELSDAEGLASVNRFRFGNYTLTGDIELGDTEVVIKTFAGSFNGGGHTVRGEKALRFINNHGSISDLALEGARLSGDSCALFCGSNYGIISEVAVGGAEVTANEAAFVLNNSGRIVGCTVGSDYICSESCAGFALVNTGVIEGCEFNGRFDCTGSVGGIAGKLKKGRISNCIIRGRVDSSRDGSCGAAALQSGGKIEKCFVDIAFAEGVGNFYPICSSVLLDGGGSVTQCYAVSNEGYIICGDCVLIQRDELCAARLTGFDFEKDWYFDGDNVLRLRRLAEGPVPERTAEPEPTAAPDPTATPKPTATPVPATPAPTLSPEEIYGELEVYPGANDLFEQPVSGRIKGGHNANVRPGPGGEYTSVLMRIPSGEAVEVYGRNGEYCLIKYNDIFGWVNASLINMDGD